MIASKSLIAGSWEDGAGSSFTSYDPANEEKLGVHQGVEKSQVDRAVEGAASAYVIYKVFDTNSSLDIREVILDFSKAFDNVWHDGLMYNQKYL